MGGHEKRHLGLDKDDISDGCSSATLYIVALWCYTWIGY